MHPIDCRHEGRISDGGAGKMRPSPRARGWAWPELTGRSGEAFLGLGGAARRKIEAQVRASASPESVPTLMFTIMTAEPLAGRGWHHVCRCRGWDPYRCHGDNVTELPVANATHI